jgi:RNA-directed DNA polymerase
MGDPEFRRLYYVRYADDFVIGFTGPKNEAKSIHELIVTFLQNKLALTCNENKSSLNHSSQNFQFLGTLVR